MTTQRNRDYIDLVDETNEDRDNKDFTVDEGSSYRRGGTMGLTSTESFHIDNNGSHPNFLNLPSIGVPKSSLYVDNSRNPITGLNYGNSAENSMELLVTQDGEENRQET